MRHISIMFIFENVSKTSASNNDLFALIDQTNVLALKVFAFSLLFGTCHHGTKLLILFMFALPK